VEQNGRTALKAISRDESRQEREVDEKSQEEKQLAVHLRQMESVHAQASTKRLKG